MDSNISRKPLWTIPWGFSEGFIIVFGLLFVSFGLEIIFPFSNVSKPHFPNSLYFLIGFGIFIFLTSFFFRSNSIVKWLSSVNSAIPAITYFVFVVLLIGIIPQSNHHSHLGIFSSLLNSWVFFFSFIFLLLTLGFATISRLFHISWKNFVFFLNHFGLWLCLAAGFFGAPDKQEAVMIVNRGDVVWYGKNDMGIQVELPIAIELLDFTAEFYQPKLAILSDEIFTSNNEYDLSSSPEVLIDNIIVQVEKYLPKAFFVDSAFINASGVPFSSHAVYVKVFNKNYLLITKGWLSTPTKVSNAHHINLPDGRNLKLLPPEPKYFGSSIKVYSKVSESVKVARVEVNKPFVIDGWWVYQHSYDNLAGNESSYSGFRVVKDPWMYAVYFGFVLMIIGVSLLLFTQSFKTK